MKYFIRVVLSDITNQNLATLKEANRSTNKRPIIYNSKTPVHCLSISNFIPSHVLFWQATN